MSHEINTAAACDVSLESIALDKCQARAGSVERPSWWRRARRVLALVLYPELGDLERKLEARDGVMSTYTEWLAECERQRRIDVDARHEMVGQMRGYKGKYLRLKAEVESATKAIAEAGRFRKALR